MTDTLKHPYQSSGRDGTSRLHNSARKKDKQKPKINLKNNNKLGGGKARPQILDISPLKCANINIVSDMSKLI